MTFGLRCGTQGAAAVLLLSVIPGFGQLAPLGQPLAAAPAQISVETANADLKTARTANQEKRYAEAEALMLKDTAARPTLAYLWIELGLAQLGQKKWAEA